MRPMSVFDSAMKVGYSDSLAVLSDAVETERRYNERLAVEDFIASPDGFDAIINDPDFQRKVAKAAERRDSLLRQFNKNRDAAVAGIRERFLAEMAALTRRHAEAVAETHRHFEMTQQGDLHFHAGRLLRARA